MFASPDPHNRQRSLKSAINNYSTSHNETARHTYNYIQCYLNIITTLFLSC